MHRSDPSAAPRHRSAFSIGTHASGIAESTISLNTLATEESLRLERFPPPPSEISTPQGTPLCSPTRGTLHTPAVTTAMHPLSSPARSMFSASSATHSRSPTVTPTRSIFATTPPLTPRRNRFPSTSGSAQESSWEHLPSECTISPRPSTRGIPADPPSISPPTSSSLLDQINKSPVVGRSARPLPAPPITGSPRSGFQPPSHDGPMGPSHLEAEAAEDRLLSTSFITALLSDYPAVVESPQSSTSQKEGAESFISTVTYPPVSPSQQTPPAASQPPLSYPYVPPLRPRHLLQNSRPPPSAYDMHARMPRSRRLSADSATLYSQSDQRPASVIRTASMSKAGPGGMSILGYAPATLQRISRSNSLKGSKATFPTLLDKYPMDPSRPASRWLNIDGEKMQFSPALPSSAAHGDINDHDRDLLHRQDSAQSGRTARSVRSFVSSFFGRSHRQQGERLMSWFRTKPLPPIPRRTDIPVTIGVQKKGDETALSLPELVERAGGLRDLLERGIHPHESVDGKTTGASWRTRDVQPLQGQELLFPQSPDSPKIRNQGKFSKTRICLTAGLISLAIIAIVAGVVVGLKQRPHHVRVCQGNWTGNACNLDATCVCASPVKGQCNALARGLISLTTTLNSRFQEDYTPNSLASAIWQASGAPMGNNCASQIQLVDVAPALDSDTYPNRTSWAQAALLWTLVKSQDPTAIAKLKDFVFKAPWKNLRNDGPVGDARGSFQVTVSGFVYNFATQRIDQPSVSFVADGQPTGAQIAQVGDKIRPVLDQMYSYALASSVQQELAMIKYWRTVLQQKPEDLALFISAISSSPILIPFDATAKAGTSPIAGLLTESPSAPFPPPPACYPGLNSKQIERLSAIETSVFSLSPVSAVTNFDSACFPDRPLYAILDITRLRLPFVEARKGMPLQAATLDRTVASRAVVFPGNLGLTSLTANDTPPATTLTDTDPRRLGTLNHLNHVMLNYLSSIPDINVAIALVQYILSSPSVPPANDTMLFNSLSSIPPLEVAIFGSITPLDISAAVSSFATPSGSLFFGSDASASLRRWAITAVGGSVVWAESATSPLVVRDASFTDSVFQSVWNPAFTLLHSPPPGAIVGVSNVTAAFRSTGKFSP